MQDLRMYGISWLALPSQIVNSNLNLKPLRRMCLLSQPGRPKHFISPTARRAALRPAMTKLSEPLAVRL
jgi:hypothetical protein